MAQTTNGFAVWLTGMHGTGKSTLMNYIGARLKQVGKTVELLDENDLGDELWEGLGDTKEERNVIVRRLGFVTNLLSRNNVAVVAAAVSPYKSSREENRRQIPRYLEVYVDCPTETLIERDSTGKYKKALNGEIPNFIGITEPYEPPNSPEVTIHSDTESVEDGALRIFQALLDLGLLSSEDIKTITGTKMKANRPGKAPPPPAKGKAAPAPKGGKAAAPAKGAKAAPAKAAARPAKPAAKAAPARAAKPAAKPAKKAGKGKR